MGDLQSIGIARKVEGTRVSSSHRVLAVELHETVAQAVGHCAWRLADLPKIMVAYDA
jgi:hypothetical protein